MHARGFDRPAQSDQRRFPTSHALAPNMLVIVNGVVGNNNRRKLASASFAASYLLEDFNAA